MIINVVFSYNSLNVVKSVNFVPRIGETVHIKFDDVEVKTLNVLSVEHSDVFYNPMQIVVRLVKGKK